MEDEDKAASREGGFWKTLPGVLTGIAAVATAVAGLVVALDHIGLFGYGKEIVSTSTDQTQTEPQRKIEQHPPLADDVAGKPGIAQVSIVQVDGTTTVVGAASLYYESDNEFRFDDGHVIPFSKVASAEVVEVLGNRAELRLTLMDGTAIKGSVEAGDVVGDDKNGHLRINIDKVRRMTFRW